MKGNVKRIIAILLTLVLSTSLWGTSGIFSVNVVATTYNGVCGEKLTWEFDSDTGVLNIAGTGNMNNYSSTSAPWTTYSSEIIVLEIGEGVTSLSGFSNLKITELNIPKTVNVIEANAFSGCTELESVYISEYINNIGEGAFASCSSIVNFTVNKDNKYYDSRDNCNAIIETSIDKLVAGCSITTIPEDIDIIGELAFSNCKDMENIKIPESVTVIEKSAFKDCINLTEINISANVNSIAEESFAGCSSVTKINVNSANQYYDSRNNCNAIIETKTNTLVAGCNNSNIPEDVRYIGPSAFYKCDKLSKLVIPNSVVKIYDYAFYNCTGVTELSIPCSASIEDVEKTFYKCKNIKKLTVTKGSTSGRMVSYDNKFAWEYSRDEIIDLVIEEGVTSIAYKAFWDIRGITKVIIPDTVTSISDFAFLNCINIKELTMPCSASICDSEYTFGACRSIEKLTLTKGTGHTKDYVLSDDIIGTFYQYTPWYISRNALKEIVLEEGIKSIGDCCFYGNTANTTLVLPKSVNTIYGNSISADITIKTYGGTPSYELAIKKGNKFECLEHSFTNYSLENEMKCYEDGLIKVKCDYCNIIESITILASHAYIERVIEPTNIEQGYTLHKCINCGESYKDSYTEIIEETTTSEIITPEITQPSTTEEKLTTTKTLEPTTTPVFTTKPVEKTIIGKTKIKSAKNIKKKSVVLKYKKINYAKKYRIQYSTDKKFKKNVHYKTTKTLKITINKLKQDKVYYFRVRGINGSVKGKWSNTKKVKVKK